MSTEKEVLCFPTLARFIAAEDVKTDFHGGSCISLINGMKGSLDTRPFPLCFHCVQLHSGKTKGFLFFLSEPRGNADDI